MTRKSQSRRAGRVSDVEFQKKLADELATKRRIFTRSRISVAVRQALGLPVRT